MVGGEEWEGLMDRDTREVFSAIEAQLRRIAYALESPFYHTMNKVCGRCGCTLLSVDAEFCPVCYASPKEEEDGGT